MSENLSGTDGAADDTADAGRELAEKFGAEVPEGCALALAEIRPVHVHAGVAVAHMEIGSQHLNQVGVVQGGVYTTFADATAGFAAMSLLAEDKTFTTLAMHINLFRGARLGDVLVAEARPVHAGSRTMSFDVRLVRHGDAAAKPVALFSCTQLVLDRA